MPERAAAPTAAPPLLPFSPLLPPPLLLLLLLLLSPTPAAAAPADAAGLQLVAGRCAAGAPANDSQVFALSAPGADGLVTISHPGSGLCVEAWPGSDLGFGERLLLQACQPARAWQRWNASEASSGPNGTIRASTPILGCLGWNNYGNDLREGNQVSPYSCTAPPSADEFFSFSAASGAIGIVAGAPDWCVTVESGATAAAPTGAYVLNDQAPGALGATFEGVGVSAAGGASRLLYEYDPVPRALALDVLFLPAAQGGLGPHMLRIEIGGDAAILSGAEPAHQRSADEPSQAAVRGTQVWLALQAKQRNAALKVLAVPHAWPGWLAGPGLKPASPFGAAPRAAAYVADWLAAVAAAGLAVDYVGVYDSFWSATLVPTYVAALRAELDSRGGALAATLIVCGDADASNLWACSGAAATDPDLRAAVAAFGEHTAPGVDVPNVAGAGRWVTGYTSGVANLRSAGDLAAAMGSAFATAGVTAFVSFAAVSASYNTLPGFRAGAVDASQPWSGFWSITPTWYVLAHTTQFSAPGMRQLKTGLGSGALWRGGSFVTRVSEASRDFSVTITTLASGGYAGGKEAPELAAFQLGGALLAKARALGAAGVPLWTTCLGSSGANASFFASSVLQLGGAQADTLSLWVLPGCLYTIATLPGRAPAPPPPASTPAVPTAFFGQRADDFSGRSPGQPGAFWADVHGAFEVVDDAAAGRGLQQRAAAPRPLSTSPHEALTDLRPHTVLGDATWRDADATVRFWLPTASDCAGLGLRVSSFNATDKVTGAGAADGTGVWLGVCATGADPDVPTGFWSAFSSLDRAQPPAALGALVAPLQPLSWHTLRLIVRGDSAVCLLDGVLLARLNVSLAAGFPSLGFMGLAVGDFGGATIFGPYLVTALGTTCSAVPREGDEPRLEPCQGGTPGQSLVFSGVPGAAADIGGPLAAGTPGTLALEYNSSLCLTMDRATGEDYGYEHTKRVNLTACVAGEPRQQFTLEAGTADGGDGVVGPVQGPDGLVLNAYRWGDDDDTPLRSYPFQSSSNELFAFDAASGSLFAPYEGLCVSFCERE
jgi:hypothetical protein